MTRALAVNRTRGRETEAELAEITINTDGSAVLICLDDEEIEVDGVELAAAVAAAFAERLA